MNSDINGYRDQAVKFCPLQYVYLKLCFAGVPLLKCTYIILGDVLLKDKLNTFCYYVYLVEKYYIHYEI